MENRIANTKMNQVKRSNSGDKQKKSKNFKEIKSKRELNEFDSILQKMNKEQLDAVNYLKEEFKKGNRNPSVTIKIDREKTKPLLGIMNLKFALQLDAVVDREERMDRRKR